MRAISRSEGGFAVVRVGEGDGDGAGVEDLAEQAGGGQRQHRSANDAAKILTPLSRSSEVDLDVDRDRVDETERDEDDHCKRAAATRAQAR